MAGGTQDDRLPVLNETVECHTGPYVLLTSLGDGGYGKVFSSKDRDGRPVAIKVEKFSRSMLGLELEVLRAAAAQNMRHFCRAIDYGSIRPQFAFIVMTMLQKDLYKLRSDMERRRFTLSTVLRVGIQTMEAIREMHTLGYISRDVKPSNFAPGLRENRQQKTIFMFDFGLARKFRDSNGNVVPARPDIGWRGTNRYGSLQAHRRHDLGRKDDVESWFYQLVEGTKGQLPWRNVPERAQVFELKRVAREGEGRVRFLEECPSGYDSILTIIDGLAYADEPPYEQILDKLRDICEREGVNTRQAFDWEDDDLNSTQSLRGQRSPSDRNRSGSNRNNNNSGGQRGIGASNERV